MDYVNNDISFQIIIKFAYDNKIIQELLVEDNGCIAMKFLLAIVAGRQNKFDTK